MKLKIFCLLMVLILSIGSFSSFAEGYDESLVDAIVSSLDFGKSITDMWVGYKNAGHTDDEIYVAAVEAVKRVRANPEKYVWANSTLDMGSDEAYLANYKSGSTPDLGDSSVQVGTLAAFAVALLVGALYCRRRRCA